jgi:hypothetical protein
MERIINDEDLVRKVGLLIKLQAVSHVGENVPLDSALTDALTYADMAYSQILTLGKERVLRIRNSLGNVGSGVDEHVFDYHKFGTDFYAIHLRGKQTVSYDLVKCAARVLNTYRTLLTQKEKIEKFRRLKSLDDAFGDL